MELSGGKLETIVLGGGCFWCTEAAYQMVKGVKSVQPGYAGGSEPDPTYYQVASGSTRHAEVVKVEFNPAEVSLTDILDVFWIVHDPTTKNRQGNDVGLQYRSIILYADEKHPPVIKKSIEDAQKLWQDPIVTEVAKLDHFYPAEEEHRDYFRQHPEQAYCQIIINPKLEKLRQKYSEKLV